MKTRTTAAAVLVIVLLLPSPCLSAAQVPWDGDGFDAALEKAGKEKGFVMLAVLASWCGYCRKMEQSTWSSQGVVDALAEKRIVPVRIDPDKDGKARARRLGVSSYPTIVFFAPDGGELGRIAGFRPPDQFIPAMGDILADPRSEAELRELIASNPEDAAALYALSKRLAFRSDAESAGERLSLLRSAVEKDPSNGREVGAQAQIDWVAAGLARMRWLAFVDQIPPQIRNDVDTLAGSWFGAEGKAVGENLESYETSTSALSESAVAAAVMRIAQARSALESMEGAEPDTAILWQTAGQLDDRRKGLRMPAEVWDAVYALLADVEREPVPLKRIAEYMLQRGKNLEDAEAAARKSMAASSDPGAAILVGRILHARGRTEEAAAMLKKTAEELRAEGDPRSDEVEKALQMIQPAEGGDPGSPPEGPAS